MPALDIAEIADADVEAVAALWARCGLTRPWNDPAADIAFARSVPGAAVLVGRAGGEIVASAMVGHDGHRGTVYYVSVDPDRQGEGHGRGIMAAAEDWLRRQGVWKLNLMVRADNTRVVAFYNALGYDTEERINMSKWLDPSKRPG
ncbi:GNAT family acetyltransferase [Microbaculum marinum]|uniref:GNAT family acetyltransferase n=1 Tax=Microbaculum marinum TaxID=1764581 RepID=A0AAW9RVY3_9HYPH